MGILVTRGQLMSTLKYNFNSRHSSPEDRRSRINNLRGVYVRPEIQFSIHRVFICNSK